MKRVELTQKFFTIVDDEDYLYLKNYKWDVCRSKYSYYARTRIKDKNNKRNTILMHRMIMKAPKYMQVDHISGNGLNNLKNNLRLCTQTQNNGNTRLSRHNTSGIKGVHWNKKRQIWIAVLHKNNKPHYLGSFNDKFEAKKVYEKAAKEYFGEFAATIIRSNSYNVISRKLPPGIQKKDYNKGLCFINSCERNATSRGYCDKHYKRFIYNPSQKGKIKIIKGNKCIIKDCNRISQYKGYQDYCYIHYVKFIYRPKKRLGKIDKRFKDYNKGMCSDSGCNESAKTKGLCKKHYQKDIRLSK